MDSESLAAIDNLSISSVASAELMEQGTRTEPSQTGGGNESNLQLSELDCLMLDAASTICEKYSESSEKSQALKILAEIKQSKCSKSTSYCNILEYAQGLIESKLLSTSHTIDDSQYMSARRVIQETIEKINCMKDKKKAEENFVEENAKQTPKPSPKVLGPRPLYQQALKFQFDDLNNSQAWSVADSNSTLKDSQAVLNDTGRNSWDSIQEISVFNDTEKGNIEVEDLTKPFKTHACKSTGIIKTSTGKKEQITSQGDCMTPAFVVKVFSRDGQVFEEVVRG
jgi:hypothetical protein